MAFRGSALQNWSICLSALVITFLSVGVVALKNTTDMKKNDGTISTQLKQLRGPEGKNVTDSEARCTSSRLAYLLLGNCFGLSASLITLFSWKNATIEDWEIPPWTSEFASSFLILGGFSAGALMQRYGRVPVLELAILTIGVGWVVVYLSEIFLELFSVGSSLVTFALGMMAPALCVYIIETHPLEASRQFSAGTITMLGILMSFFFLHISSLKTLVVFLHIITLMSYYSLHRNVLDSPVWLMSKRYFEEASSSFKWFGLGLTDNNADANILKARSAELCKDRENARMSTSKMFAFIFLQQITTNHLLYYYLVRTGIPIDIAASMAYVLLGVIPSLALSENFDKRIRRRSSLSSTIIVCMTYLMVSVYEYNFKEGEDNRVPPDDHHLFLYTCTLFNCIFGYLYGLYSLPWIMTVENTPSDIRGLTTSILWAVNYISVRLWLQMYELMMPFIEIYGIWFIFLMMAAVAVLFHLYLWLESLDSKSLLEIEISVAEGVPTHTEINSPA